MDACSFHRMDRFRDLDFKRAFSRIQRSGFSTSFAMWIITRVGGLRELDFVFQGIGFCFSNIRILDFSIADTKLAPLAIENNRIIALIFDYGYYLTIGIKTKDRREEY